MKIKNKGKIYPSPSSSSSASGCDGDYLAVLKLLPAAILAIASVLSLEDREVLAYMITISMKTTTTTATTTKPKTSIDCKRSSKSSKKASSSSNNNATHKPPVLDCDCFECYTSYWFKWDSSPNRELIHQAIEAFEEHLTKGESEKSKKGSRTKRRDKSGRRVAVKPADVSCEHEMLMPVVLTVEESDNSPKNEIASQEVAVTPSSSVSFVVDDNNKVLLPEEDVASSEEMKEEVEVAAEVEEDEEEEEMAVSTRTTAGAASSHKGLARKVLPDVLGLFNSRLWSLWGPNV